MASIQARIEVGVVRDQDEGVAFFRMAADALLAPLTVVDVWREREGLENVRVARVDGKLAGGLSVQRMGQWFGGRSVRCGVVRVVAVGPEFRGSGVADTFLKHALLEMREARIPISMLFPATQVIYRRVGFEQAGSWVDYSVPLVELPTRERELAVSQVSLDDARIRRLYDTMAQRSTGLMDRNEWLWTRTLRHPLSPGLAAYLIGPDDTPEGYVLVSAAHEQNERYGTLRVKDRALLTPRAHRRALSFFAEHRSMVEDVRFAGGLVEPLLVGLANQRQRIVRREDWMLRLIDVPAALEMRGYPPGVDVELHLLVRDDVLEPHEQRIVLRVRDGRAEVDSGTSGGLGEKSGAGGAGGYGQIEIDVRGLAALYSGHMAPSEVAALGYLSGDERAASALAAVFAGATSWMSEVI